MANISIDNIAKEIAKQLAAYTEEVEEEVEVAKKEVAGTLMARLVSTSPEATGSYKNGWRIKKFKNKLVVHNKTDYQLTHLLEHGHAKVGGGRVPARVHIRPAEEEAVRTYISRVERAVKG